MNRRNIPNPFESDFLKGGPGSGNFGHKGRVGIRGGSAKEGGSSKEEAGRSSHEIASMELISAQNVGTVYKTTFKDGQSFAYKPDSFNSLDEWREKNGYPLRSSVDDTPPQSVKEVFAYELDQELGFGVVPETKFADLKDGLGKQVQEKIKTIENGRDKTIGRIEIDLLSLAKDDRPSVANAINNFINSSSRTQQEVMGEASVVKAKILSELKNKYGHENASLNDMQNYNAAKAVVNSLISDAAQAKYLDADREALEVKLAKSGNGHIQKWVDGTIAMKHTMSSRPYEDTDKALISYQKIAALDVLLGNTDRHPGNFMFGEDGQYHAIDNGLSMPHKPLEFRSIPVQRLSGGPIHKDILSSIKKLDIKKVSAKMKARGFKKEAIDYFEWRANKLKSATHWSDVYNPYNA